MPSLIDEQTQFTDTDGLPIVNGSIYIGTQNSDPVANAITIYSDRDLTTPIANPQSTDGFGRSVNKIWMPGKYSIQVNNSAGVQKYSDLDAGSIPQTGITTLTNVQGTNTITAEGTPAIATLTDQQQYNFTTAAANTGAVTLQIDLTAAKAIKKQHDVDLVSGDLEADQIVAVIYNGTDDVYELVSNIGTADTAQVTNHIRAGNIQVLDGTASGGSGFVVTGITVSTWETVGPTGSGATNIWTPMDVIPANATIMICHCRMRVNPTAATDHEVEAHAASGDVASPVAGISASQILGLEVLPGISGDDKVIEADVWIPLGASQITKINWTSTGAGTPSIVLYYKGFITD